MRPTVVVVETLDRPRPISVRIAQALAHAGSARVLLCHWHGLHFSADSLLLRGPVHHLTDQREITADVIESALQVDALYFHGPHSGTLSAKDAAALDALTTVGIDVRKVPMYIVVDRILLEASRRGIVTNALGRARSWGPKHQQEIKLRRYEMATQNLVARPQTYVAGPSEVSAALSFFAHRGETCVVKPAFGEGGKGFRLVTPGDSSHSPDSNIVVIQHLIPDPLLVAGCKADIRCYILIDLADHKASRLLGPVFVRRSAVPYIPGHLPAEITNTSYWSHHGYPSNIYPIQTTPGISKDLRTQILAQLHRLSRTLIDAYFWDAYSWPADSQIGVTSNSVIIFGVDVLVANPSRKPRLYFLEMNPFPALFRGSPPCDQAVDQMLSQEYLPALLRARAR